jgi:hypothetical protein
MKNTVRLDEFNSLEDALKGDCDNCKLDCRDRLTAQSYQIERFEKAIQRFEVVTEALAEIVVQNHPDSFQRRLNELTARILGNTGEPKCQKSEGESSSSQSNMLKQFAKSTH